MEVLAREAGVSQSTVSLALRNDPRVATRTRNKIHALAEKMKYRPDPALSALVAYRARVRSVSEYGTLAVLHDSDRAEDRLPPALQQHVAGIRSQAQKLGYKVELFRVRPEPEESMKLSRILYARGIAGLILTSLGMRTLEMEWSHFSSVVIGEYFSQPKLNHVRHHHSDLLTLTYQELRKLGYRKIGFANLRISEERKRYLYFGAYLKCLWLDGINPASSPPLLYEENERWTPVPWLERHGFDAVMAFVPQLFLERLQGTRFSVPNTLGLAGFATPAAGPYSHIAGGVLDLHRIGAVAVDFLQAMIHRGQRGVPSADECYDVVVRGVWRPGSTVRPVKPRPAKRKRTKMQRR
jgi:DNA-binding LacI/PurR family transcriptional regulator